MARQPFTRAASRLLKQLSAFRVQLPESLNRQELARRPWPLAAFSLHSLARQHPCLGTRLTHCPRCQSKNVGLVLVTEGSDVSNDQIEHLKSRRRGDS